MPNAEGRMEETHHILARHNVTHPTDAERCLASEIATLLLLRQGDKQTLAAARAENEKLREALAHYANAVNWMSHTDADAMLRVWIGSGDGPDYARRALAAQEGTDG